MNALALKHRLIGGIFRAIEAMQDVVNVHVDTSDRHSFEYESAARRRILGLLRELEPWGIFSDSVASAVEQYLGICKTDDYKPVVVITQVETTIQAILAERDAALAALAAEPERVTQVRLFYEKRLTKLFQVKEADDAFTYE